MINHITGSLSEVSPTHAVIETNGVGYLINISLNTYSKITDLKECKLLTFLSIKEDAHTLYGFFEPREREVFKLLISVNGVGTNTARMMLSSLTAQEVSEAIIQGNVSELQSVKGIGGKTAQRIILDLKDKMGNESLESGEILSFKDNTSRNEALSALLALGFNKSLVEKTLKSILKAQPSLGVEDLVKEALKKM